MSKSIASKYDETDLHEIRANQIESLGNELNRIICVLEKMNDERISEGLMKLIEGKMWLDRAEKSMRADSQFSVKNPLALEL